MRCRLSSSRLLVVDRVRHPPDTGRAATPGLRRIFDVGRVRARGKPLPFLTPSALTGSGHPRPADLSAWVAPVGRAIRGRASAFGGCTASCVLIASARRRRVLPTCLLASDRRIVSLEHCRLTRVPRTACGCGVRTVERTAPFLATDRRVGVTDQLAASRFVLPRHRAASCQVPTSKRMGAGSSRGFHGG